MVNCSSSEFASSSNSYRLEPILGDRVNEFLAILNEDPAEVPPAVAGPSSEHPSTVKIVKRVRTNGKPQKPEVLIENTTFIPHREPLFELSHLVEQGRTAANRQKPAEPLKDMTFVVPPVRPYEVSHPVEEHGGAAAKPLKPEAQLTIQRHKVHNYTMKQQIVVSFKDTTTMLRYKICGAIKQPTGGYSCKFCSKFMNDKKKIRGCISERIIRKSKYFSVHFVKGGTLKKISSRGTY